jgi:hypothetical protein
MVYFKKEKSIEAMELAQWHIGEPLPYLSGHKLSLTSPENCKN